MSLLSKMRYSLLTGGSKYIKYKYLTFYWRKDIFGFFCLFVCLVFPFFVFLFFFLFCYVFSLLLLTRGYKGKSINIF